MLMQLQAFTVCAAQSSTLNSYSTVYRAIPGRRGEQNQSACLGGVLGDASLSACIRRHSNQGA